MFTCALNTFQFLQLCCYSAIGSLITTEDGLGGQASFYHPKYTQQYETNDRQPKRWCCQLTDNCHLFYSVRQIDRCQGYTPPTLGEFMQIYEVKNLRRAISDFFHQSRPLFDNHIILSSIIRAWHVSYPRHT